MSTTLRFFRFASPAAFYPLAGKLVPWFTAIAAILAAIGLYLGMLRAPTDATQGDAYRIIFIHVPAAWMSMLLYVVMAFWAAIGWAFNARLASIVARAIAPTGAMFTFLALWTGALWGKPTWGAWWVWDARLTSELILLFLYAGYIALVSAIDDTRRADRAGALLADRRQRQRADHLFLGDLVEHAAPRGKRQRHHSAENGERDAAGDAADDARVLGLRLRGHLRPHQGHRAGTRQSRGVGERRGRARPRAPRSKLVNWNSAADFFAMGGYGTYVWGAYAVTLACMAVEPVLVVLRHRRARRELGGAPR